MKKFLTMLALALSLSTIGFCQIKGFVIEKSYDKFDKVTTYSCSAGSISVYSYLKDGDTLRGLGYNSLGITVRDSYLCYASDLTLLFSDGDVLKFKTDKKLGEYDGDGKYVYYLFISLTREQFIYLYETLETKKLVGFKYHIFERNYNQSDKLREIIKDIFKIK